MQLARDRRDDRRSPIGADRFTRRLRERLRACHHVDHCLRGHVLFRHRELPLRPLVADPMQRRSCDLVEQLGQRMPAQPQPGKLRHQRWGVAAQGRLGEVADRLLTQLVCALGHGRRQRSGGLVLPLLHERGDVAQAELAVAAGRAEAVDLAGVGPSFHGGLAHSEQRCDLPCR